jgi:hypothetical protein
LVGKGTGERECYSENGKVQWGGKRAEFGRKGYNSDRRGTVWIERVQCGVKGKLGRY